MRVRGRCFILLLHDVVTRYGKKTKKKVTRILSDKSVETKQRRNDEQRINREY